MSTLMATILVLAQEAEENAPEDLYPHLNELIVGAIAFFVLFFFIGRWALPRINQMAEERRARIQGELEKAERSKVEAEQLLARYEEQLKEARSEASRIIEEARKTADSVRKDMLDKAEEEARQVVGRAQQEIRAERERTFEELRVQLGELSIEVASRIIGESLDKRRQTKLVDDFIDEVTRSGNGQPRATATKSTARKASSTKSTATKSTSTKSSSSKSTSTKKASAKRTASRRKR